MFAPETELSSEDGKKPEMCLSSTENTPSLNAFSSDCIKSAPLFCVKSTSDQSEQSVEGIAVPVSSPNSVSAPAMAQRSASPVQST